MNWLAELFRWLGFLTFIAGTVCLLLWIIPYIGIAAIWIAGKPLLSGLSLMAIGIGIFFLGQLVSPYVSKADRHA